MSVIPQRELHLEHCRSMHHPSELTTKCKHSVLLWNKGYKSTAEKLWCTRTFFWMNLLYCYCKKICPHFAASRIAHFIECAPTSCDPFTFTFIVLYYKDWYSQYFYKLIFLKHCIALMKRVARTHTVALPYTDCSTCLILDIFICQDKFVNIVSISLHDYLTKILEKYHMKHNIHRSHANTYSSKCFTPFKTLQKQKNS